jgi:hypothetical protein
MIFRNKLTWVALLGVTLCLMGGSVLVNPAHAEGGTTVAADDTTLPANAKGFAGRIAGEVVSVGDGRFVLAVTKIIRTNPANKAEDGTVLVGRKVLIVGRKDSAHAQFIARFIAALKAGEKIEVIVRNLDGDALTIMELTKEQRPAVGQK